MYLTMPCNNTFIFIKQKQYVLDSLFLLKTKHSNEAKKE